MPLHVRLHAKWATAVCSTFPYNQIFSQLNKYTNRSFKTICASTRQVGNGRLSHFFLVQSNFFYNQTKIETNNSEIHVYLHSKWAMPDCFLIFKLWSQSEISDQSLKISRFHTVTYLYWRGCFIKVLHICKLFEMYDIISCFPIYCLKLNTKTPYICSSTEEKKKTNCADWH